MNRLPVEECWRRARLAGVCACVKANTLHTSTYTLFNNYIILYMSMYMYIPYMHMCEKEIALLRSSPCFERKQPKLGFRDGSMKRKQAMVIPTHASVTYLQPYTESDDVH